MFIVVGSVQVKKGHLEAALALSLEHVRRSRAEPGCLSHSVGQDAEDAHRLVFVEEWDNHAALLQHFAVPASRAFARQIADMAVEPPRMAVHQATPVPR